MLDISALEGLVASDLEAIDSQGGGTEGAKANIRSHGVDPDAIQELGERLGEMSLALIGPENAPSAAFNSGFSLGMAAQRAVNSGQGQERD